MLVHTSRRLSYHSGLADCFHSSRIVKYVPLPVQTPHVLVKCRTCDITCNCSIKSCMMSETYTRMVQLYMRMVHTAHVLLLLLLLVLLYKTHG